MSGDSINDSPDPGFSSMLMTATAASIFVITVLVVALRLYARCIYREQASSLALVQQMAHLAVAAQEQGPHDRPKVGLDPAIIAALPSFTYRGGSGEAVDCAVCLSALEEGEMARALPKCMHIFHTECIDMWLHSHATCPICRVRAVAEAHLEGPSLNTGRSESGYSTNISVLGASNDGQTSNSLRLGSLIRMLSRDQSERRLHGHARGDSGEDLESQ